jgi:hypothetical protein
VNRIIGRHQVIQTGKPHLLVGCAECFSYCFRQLMHCICCAELLFLI